MSDQPETMLEYHFRKLSRKIAATALLVMASIYLAAGAVVHSSDPVMSWVFIFGAVLTILAAIGASNEGYARRTLNRLFRTDLTDLERPDEPGEAPANRPFRREGIDDD